MFCILSKTLMEETKFSPVSAYQLETASGMEIRALSTSPLKTGSLSSDVCLSCYV